MSETTNLKLFKQDNPTTNTNNFDIEKTLNDNWDKLDENAGTTNKKLESLEKVVERNTYEMYETFLHDKIDFENSLGYLQYGLYCSIIFDLKIEQVD